MNTLPIMPRVSGGYGRGVTCFVSPLTTYYLKDRKDRRLRELEEASVKTRILKQMQSYKAN